MKQIRVFIIDDSVVFRKLLSDVINAIPNVRVSGVAANGQEALEKLPGINPDFITLDLEMPVMDGLETLERLGNSDICGKVVMLSAYTFEGAQATIQALEAGAFDFIPKPSFQDIDQCREYLRTHLSRVFIPPDHKKLTRTGDTQVVRPLLGACHADPHIIAIGVSTGGPNALTKLLSSLPAGFPVPILIVQHMPKLFTRSLAESLNRTTGITVLEGEQGMQVRPGHAYIAPGDMQMKVSHSSESKQTYIELTDDPPENFCKPSVDYLFRSVAQVYREHAIGVILTGMGSDGVLGLRLMKRHGVFVIGQDRNSSTVYGMPREAKNAGVVDIELPIDEIGQELIRRVNSKK